MTRCVRDKADLTPVFFDIGTLGKTYFPAFKSFYGLTHGAVDIGSDLDASRLQGLKGIGTTVTGKHGFDSILGHQAGGLNPGPVGGINIGSVIQSLPVHGFRIYDNKVFGPAKAKIYG